MKLYTNCTSEQLDAILRRPSYDHVKIEKIVQPILDKVIRGGDKALRKLALEYDHVELDDLWVDETLINSSWSMIDDTLKNAIHVAKDNIWKFHESQREQVNMVETMPGVLCYRRSVPIQRVGLYIPGGTAPLFSTVLMLGIPARIAGCKEIILSTPTNKVGEINPVVLYTAHLLGINKILKLGGAQAIAAMAFGSETVPKVDKIFGPGNQFVTTAKQLVARDQVAIDMPAGPSEVLVVIDETSKSSFAAADLLSQAEHGTDSQVVLVSTSKKKAKKVLRKIEEQLQDLPRKTIAEEALNSSSAIVVESLDEMVSIINRYGPEHLILNIKDANNVLDDIVNAGSVFIGQYTPESMGDYASGTNHTLPTNGWARSISGVSLDSFVKKITYQEVTEAGLKALGPVVETMAEAEQLVAHRRAVSVRLASLTDD